MQTSHPQSINRPHRLMWGLTPALLCRWVANARAVPFSEVEVRGSEIHIVGVPVVNLEVRRVGAIMELWQK